MKQRIEDGFGCSGLVPTAAEKQEEQERKRLEAEIDRLKAALRDRESGLAELLTLRDRAKAFLACADPNGPWSQDEREGLAYLRQAVHAIEKGTA